MRQTRMGIAMIALLAATSLAPAADLTASLQVGTPDIKSVGPLAFGPEGILFVGDPQGAAVFAIATWDAKSAGEGIPRVEALDAKIAGLLGVTPRDLTINDMAVNPLSGQVYLSVTRGQGPNAVPFILRVDRTGKISEVPLKDVKFSKMPLSNATVRNRMEAITDLAYFNGKLYVAGLSNEEFASRLRVIAFPFSKEEPPAGIEIYHGSHGRFETNAPIRTFTFYRGADNEDYLLAAYTCTPLVRIPLKDIQPGAHVKGVTVAELGNRNRPLDMIVYQKGGKTSVLMANNSRGLMKITAENIEKAPGITTRVADKAGQSYETLEQFQNNVVQLDRYDDSHALVLLRTESGTYNLEPLPLP